MEFSGSALDINFSILSHYVITIFFLLRFHQMYNTFNKFLQLFPNLNCFPCLFQLWLAWGVHQIPNALMYWQIRPAHHHNVHVTVDILYLLV